MTNKINTVWMWQEGSKTYGLNIDTEKQILLWQEDLVGFGCALMPLAQSLEDFVANGAARYANPPQDVLDEIHASVAAILDTST